MPNERVAMTLGRLTDEYFDARFYGGVRADGNAFREQAGEINGAQGLVMFCPCGTHSLIVPFANPRNASDVPPDHGPWNRERTYRPRWTMSGTGLRDLSLIPSIDAGKESCWHGFITNGDVR